MRQRGLRGGQPVVAGTGITVRHIAVLYRAGQTAEQIAAAHPPLTAAQVHDALSYYLDHRDEIDPLVEQNRLRAVMRAHDLLYVVGRGLVDRGEFAALPEARRAVWYTADTLPREWDE